MFDNFYGTGRASVEALLAAGRDVILEIDWQGARQVRESAPDCTTIFILPPSRAALEERLRNRADGFRCGHCPAAADAVGDMSHYREFGYVVVNDDFDTACRQLESILAGNGQGLASDRPQLAPLLADLLGSSLDGKSGQNRPPCRRLPNLFRPSRRATTKVSLAYGPNHCRRLSPERR